MKQKLLVIVGPTAVGKTALSIQLAQKYQGQVISGDSMQVYQKLDIGTAKITPSEMQGVKHYLLDILDVKQRFSCASFITQATQAADKINTHGFLPILCGGTGFYVQALLDGFQLGRDQQASEKVRHKWHDYAKEHGQKALWDKLNEIDPVAAKKIPLANELRVVRALEVYEKTGQLFSNQADHDEKFDALVIGLTTNRQLLYDRINHRVDVMVEQGLLNEAKMLYAAGGMSLPAGKGIGYKEFYPYFAGEITLDEAIATVKKNSRHYAKRQLTWFRNKMDVNWFDLILHPEQITQIEALVSQWLTR
ncbi:tRNA dimethylallyltransferase [Ligilactobacillus sp. WC1T17]|uniref:tRNA dimethylallyltransferase n=1 Tax=Ligilactobacillus ruminis TaxID=1623 RepID=A0ABY1ABP1_9LACO|nr:tRNA dimethylallyltransferase [Ligilactobacillus ruminis]